MKILNTKNAQAIINPKQGATTISLSLKNTDILKEASFSETPWPTGGIPILFPFAGRVWNNDTVGEYIWNQQIYKMPTHGFTYQEEWQTIQESENEIILAYKSTPETIKVYPWKFNLKAHFKLKDNEFSIHLTVSNLSKDKMPIALGFHPYFKVPKEEEKTTLLELASNKIIKVTSKGNAGSSLKNNIVFPQPLTNVKLHNIIFSDLTKQSANLKYPIGKKLTIQSSLNFPYWVLWKPENSAFICVEPWMNLPDAPKRKERLQYISPGGDLTSSLSITLN